MSASKPIDPAAQVDPGELTLLPENIVPAGELSVHAAEPSVDHVGDRSGENRAVMQQKTGRRRPNPVEVEFDLKVADENESCSHYTERLFRDDPLDSAYDEMRTPDGGIRPHYQALVDTLTN